MKEFNLKVSPKKNPNRMGEILREMFFTGQVGGYNCFDWKEGVKPLEDKPVEDDPDLDWTRGELTIDEQVVVCQYFWDGDAELVFLFEDGSALMNTDAKKDYNWAFLTKEQFEQYHSNDYDDMMWQDE